MANKLHGALVNADGIHTGFSYVYADETARLAASGFVADDIGKIAWQQDNNTTWILTAVTPTWVQLADGLPYGQEFNSVESTPLQSTSSATFVQAWTHTTPVLPIGTYRFEFFMTVEGSVAGNHIAWQIDLDNVPDLLAFGDNEGNPAVVTGQYVAGWAMRTFLTAAAHDIDIDHRLISGGGLAYNYRRGLSYWRVT